jgi:hypothetical protein
MEPAAQHRGELCLGGGKLGNMQRGLRQQGVDHLAGRHGMYFVFTVAVYGHVGWRPSACCSSQDEELEGWCEKDKKNGAPN